MESLRGENAPEAHFLNEHCAQAKGNELIVKGLKAFREIKGLKTHYLKGVTITFILVIIIFSLKFMYLYQPFVAPFIDQYVEKVNGYWAWLTYLSTPIAWLIKFIVWVIMIFSSMKISSLFMSFWLDTLVEKIILHFRGVPESPFNLPKIVKTIVKGLGKSIGNMMFAIFCILLGFLPIIGPIFAFIGGSCSNGFDIISPYIMVLAERDEKLLDEFKITRKKTFLSGFMHTILTFIPGIGWIALPFSLLGQVVGYTYYCEEKWQEHSKLIENS
ncbi:MAG: EI24 domain-containing protein [Lentisphaeraceae bacterium]|nr:EI24 domain-containing protein [Lentisphaeraceae bacterium]